MHGLLIGQMRSIGTVIAHHQFFLLTSRFAAHTLCAANLGETYLFRYPAPGIGPTCMVQGFAPGAWALSRTQNYC
jgi:hypothetical protein